MNWRDTLAEALQRSSPRHICALDVAALAIARDLLPEASVALFAAPAQNDPPAQLALVMNALNDLDAAQARTLLARVRDFITSRIIVIADTRCPLDRMDFLAIGYDTLGTDKAGQTKLYQFDLATYKQVPDWLNARYWAHPERWKP
jgi:hypothetical protein